MNNLPADKMHHQASFQSQPQQFRQGPQNMAGYRQPSIPQNQNQQPFQGQYQQAPQQYVQRDQQRQPISQQPQNQQNAAPYQGERNHMQPTASLPLVPVQGPQPMQPGYNHQAMPVQNQDAVYGQGLPTHPVGYMPQQMGPPHMQNYNQIVYTTEDENYIKCGQRIDKEFAKMKEEIEKIKTDGSVPAEQVMEQFKQQKLPLARIKKIMKSDEEVRMISAEAPILFAKACEMFIAEMTIKGYYNAEKHERKTLQRKDVATAIARTETYDFLIDTIPKSELQQHVSPDTFTPYQQQLLNRGAAIYDEQQQALPVQEGDSKQQNPKIENDDQKPNIDYAHEAGLKIDLEEDTSKNENDNESQKRKRGRKPKIQ